jgi:hypothetical protein
MENTSVFDDKCNPASGSKLYTHGLGGYELPKTVHKLALLFDPLLEEENVQFQSSKWHLLKLMTGRNAPSNFSSS